MKKIVPIGFIIALFLTTVSAGSQDLTGIWRGYFQTAYGEHYKYEIQLNQTQRNSLSGVTYSYLDTRFYGKTTFSGNFIKSSKAALVQEIKTVELRMSDNSVACIMKCRLVYSRSGREEFLEGVYSSRYEKTDASKGVKRGDDCGGGKVFLRKVPISDFYEEPFLRKKGTKPSAPVDELVKDNPVPKQRVNKPARTEKKTRREASPEPAFPSPQKAEEVTKETKPAITPKIPVVPATIRNRKNELTKTIYLQNKEVEVSIYDNGEIDDDTVSIYLDGALLLANKRLSNKPITFTLTTDESNPEHTLIMLAENLGRIPPNTSLMIVQDGDRRHQVSITSTEQKNAMVRFRYQKEEEP